MNTLAIMVSIFVVSIFFVNVIVLSLFHLPISDIGSKTLLWLDAAFVFFFTVIYFTIRKKL